MAGTILTSSPHYFLAVEDYHACLMKNWQALATLLHLYVFAINQLKDLFLCALLGRSRKRKEKDSFFFLRFAHLSLIWFTERSWNVIPMSFLML